MQASTEPAISPQWSRDPEPERPADATRWLHQAQRFSLVRTHISVFAVGSVGLLCINLLAGSSRVWASTWISAWALLVIIHAVVAVIATLALQLLADDEEIRPASEVSWEPSATWVAPAPPPPAPEVPAPVPQADPWHAPTPPPGDEDRVSWKAASDAAWLNRPATPDANEPTPPANEPSSDDTSAGQQPS